MDAGKGVHGLSVDSLRMSIPPALAALVGAELDLLPAGYLHDGLSAVFAAADIRLVCLSCGSFLAVEAVPVAVGHHLILCETEGIRYIGIAESSSAELGDFCFLFTGHGIFTSSFHWRFGAILSGGFFTETKKACGHSEEHSQA